jgi:serine/threonine protein kinase
MSDTAAPATLLLRRRSTLELLALDPEREIGAGGEAVVYHVPADVALVAKLYHHPTIERARKLALLVAHPPAMPEDTAIAWPADVLLTGGGFAGFLMPYAEGPRIFEFYNPVTRRSRAPGFHAGLMHRAGRNLAAAFDALHAAGYVVGDVNESNILVAPADGRVTLVDADSLQVRDPDGGVHRSRVGKPEFTPPELQGVSFETVDRAPEHDRFGLAVLLFLLLMEGTHPFAVRLKPGSEAAPVEERIRAGLFPHASPDDDVHPPRLSPPFEMLDAGIRAMFVRAFVNGHADPAARPTAAEWRDALAAAEARLATCAVNPLHRAAPHLSACPWCERRALLGGRDPFPVDAPVTLPIPRPRRPRAPAQAPFAAPAAASQPSVSPFGVSPPPPAPVPSSPVPAMFGPAGLGNPVVIIPAGLAMLFLSHGSLPIVAGGVLVMVLGAALAFYRGLRVPSPITMMVGMMIIFAGLVLSSLPHAAAADDPASTIDGPATVRLPPVQNDPVPQTIAAADPPPSTTDDAPLPDVTVILAAHPDGEAVPETPPASEGDAAPPRLAANVKDLAQLPRLTNRKDVEAVIAALYRNRPAEKTIPETVEMWVRIGADGHVPEGGYEVISSTGPVARDAVAAAMPYLVYTPGMQDGQAVPVWARQRFVIRY